MAPQQLFHPLSHDFESLLNSQNFSDVRIIVGEASNTRTFHVHSQILAARSSYFAIALSGDWVKEKITLSGEISLNEHGPLTILELFIAADELILEKLIDHLEDYLIEHHVKELEENFATFHETSFIHHSFKKLQKFCIEIAVNNSSAVFNSQNFTSLNRNVLCSILSWDDRNMEESEIWEKIIEWGVAKLSNGIQLKKFLNWTDENFEAFKESIEELLPLIRFFNISSVDFYYKVKLFARILPGTLYEDLLHHYLVTGSHQKSQLDHWIQGKDENTPLEDQLENEFKLLLRGSRDGFSPNDFHRLCDNNGAKITVIKVKGTGQLIGGYAPKSWHSRGNWIDGKAQNAKLSKLISGLGLFGYKEFGLQFGSYSIRTYRLPTLEFVPTASFIAYRSKAPAQEIRNCK
ncbi:hypothetical protein G9A89_005303 [Geosiphon pyriformis]|nr:hypothetical protein G9A89_005303 [Geosiphon pyriformis]